MGPGTRMAKIDIKSGYEMEGLHIHRYLPPLWTIHFTPKLFNVLADLLTGIFTRQGVTLVFHYIDDFLILDLTSVSVFCASLGVPL